MLYPTPGSSWFHNRTRGNKYYKIVRVITTELCLRSNAVIAYKKVNEHLNCFTNEWQPSVTIENTVPHVACEKNGTFCELHSCNCTTALSDYVLLCHHLGRLHAYAGHLASSRQTEHSTRTWNKGFFSLMSPVVSYSRLLRVSNIPRQLRLSISQLFDPKTKHTPGKCAFSVVAPKSGMTFPSLYNHNKKTLHFSGVFSRNVFSSFDNHKYFTQKQCY